MSEPTIAYIGLGSNLGDREDFIRGAVKMLSQTEGVEVVRMSDIIETTPLGSADQNNYLNAVAEIKTHLDAENLYKNIADIEKNLGRERGEKWASRNIDLDLLLFGTEIINSAGLTVPHPQMHLRSFVLKGLCQLNGQLVHPVMKETMDELAGRLGGADFVLNPDQPQLISIAGVIGVGKTTLTNNLAKIFDCKQILEPYDTNPFMPDVYAGNKELALDSQLYFLTARAEQLNIDTLKPGRIVISDYVADKELIYAKRTLNEKQLGLYEEIYPTFFEKIATPALVVYLVDSAQKCLERIRHRNRPYEQRIALEFLKTLHSDYEQLFKNWRRCPVIRISTADFDCNRDGDVENLANQIKNYIVV